MSNVRRHEVNQRILAIESVDRTRNYRVVPIREPFLVGAHFFNDELSNESPVAFVVAVPQQDSFENYNSLSDKLLCEVCIREFSLRDHYEKVVAGERNLISVGKKLPWWSCHSVD